TSSSLELLASASCSISTREELHATNRASGRFRRCRRRPARGRASAGPRWQRQAEQCLRPMSAERVAIVTGGSRGLGLALARELGSRGWRLVIDARGADELGRAARELSELTQVQALAGDVADAGHRQALVAAAGASIDLLVNNASVLGPSPLPELGSYPVAELESVLRINAVAPLALIQLALPRMSGG